MTHLTKSAIFGVLGLTSVLAVVGCNRLNEYVAPPPPEVTVTRPTVGDVVDYAEFTGSTRALAKVDLRARISGYLKSIEFEDGAYAEILLIASGQYLRSRITRKSAVELGLQPGRKVFALIKSIAVEADRPQR